ncbi:MAG: oligoendopeptidase F [Coriobacteriales bacterium]
MERSEIAEQYTWDLSSIFESDKAFLAELERAQGYPGKLAAYQGTLADAAQLLAFMQLDDECDIVLGKLYNYAARKSDEDTRNSTYQDFQAQVETLCVKASSACSWFSNELLALGKDTVEGFYAAQPSLELYRRALDQVFRRAPHVLGPAEEALLAAAQDLASQPENTFSMLNDADMRFEDALDSQGQPHPVTHGSYVPLLMSQDRELRKNAYGSLYSAYGQFRNTSAAIMASQMKQLKFFADARKYGSTLEAALDATEVPTEVYTQLIATVRANLGALHKYTGLRKRVLGVDELRFYDLYVPMVADVEMRFSYEEACELILKALAPLGEDYLAIVREGLSQRWVDVYETPGKRSGAYSAGGYGMHPVILMNFQGELDDVFTLIHEMGHSIHTYLSCANQPSRYSDYVIFVAEVASTCNEALLMRYLLDHAGSKEEKAYLLNHFTEQFRATLYRQTMFAEFELKVNELAATGAGITADALCETYAQLNRDYFGDDVVVDEQIALEWSRIPHFYYRYYVYQYATGYAAAIALSNRILQQGAPAVADYKRFLSGGSSATPLELLRIAGVDMASPAPVQDALALYDSLVDELSELLDA